MENSPCKFQTNDLENHFLTIDNLPVIYLSLNDPFHSLPHCYQRKKNDV